MPRHATITDPYLPFDAEIVDRIQDSKAVFTLKLKFSQAHVERAYRFAPGQFNMLYLLGIGEAAISIVSDPKDRAVYDHTIHALGRVTQGLAKLKPGDHIGLRGPYGRGWPVERAQGHDVLVITGGLGCAPSVSIINYILRRRAQYGRLIILQGVKHSDDFIYHDRYQHWAQLANTEVLLAADQATKAWRWYTGYVTDLLDQVQFDPSTTLCMMCGPEAMMQVGIKRLLARQFVAQNIYVSLERNMKCAIAHCGHCQFGGKFICQDGPVFSYPEIQHLFGLPGF